MRPTELRARVVTDEREWEALGARWDGFARTLDGRCTVFQIHPFQRCWWRHVGREVTPWIVVAERGEELAGIAPLQLAHRRIWGRSYRELQFMGMPNDLNMPTFLVRQGDDAALRCLLDAIGERRHEWDLLQLDEVETESPLLTELHASSRRHGLWIRSKFFHPCPYLEKNGATWEAFAKAKSDRFTKRLRQARRKLEKDIGDLSYETLANGADAAAILDTFFDIERRSWKAKAGIATGSTPGYPEFCLELLTDSAAPYTGHGIVQRAAGKPIAATFGVSYDGVYYSLQIAHDQAFDRHSPGTLLEAFEMEWFFDHTDLHRYEFLGGAVFNKRRWTDTARSTSQVFVRRPGLHIALKDLSRFYVHPTLNDVVRPGWQRLRKQLAGKSQAITKAFRYQKEPL